MPCYSVNTVCLDFQAGELGLLQKAAAVLGLEIRPGRATRSCGPCRQPGCHAGKGQGDLHPGQGRDRQQAARAVQPGNCRPRRPQARLAEVHENQEQVASEKGGLNMKAEMELTILEGRDHIDQHRQHGRRTPRLGGRVYQAGAPARQQRRETKSTREHHHHHYHDHQHHDHKH